MENAKLHTIRNANCKYSFDSAPLHHNTSFFPSPRLPLSHSPSLPDSFSISPFPNNLRNHFPPIRSVLDKTKILQFCIDNEAFQDCTFVKVTFHYL
ncbi:hypothetical protein NC653_014991 [Populus alba x Populus x berolinensis]|uniref:Uncharacterized protein n=1 Tax=Populus alba x Populus x berolinensis TaxID=444605 RepID=A0AAD6QZI4_9ROSI|nr:hypothetical protein NC653_014991 [Populus alba x Populus x berolinensis]